jgi:hypothetical protein
MKIKYLVLCFLLTAALMAQPNGPKISFNAINHDFGTIAENSIVSYDYIVANKGTDTLNITDVRPGCGCTAAKPEKNIIMPGDSTMIHIEFNSIGRSGSQHKYIYVFSNDKENPEIRLTFSAYIEKKATDFQSATPIDKGK